MNNKNIVVGTFSNILFILMTFFLTNAWAQSDEWSKVEDAMNQGLPKTAIEHLDRIIPRALKAKSYGEATKAIARKIALEGNIEGNKPEEKIVRMEAEIVKAPAEMKPILQSILAQWYWHYFQQNRWRFLSRTTTASPPDSDFTTWDLPRLFQEIDRYYSLSLAAEKTLKATPVAVFSDLLAKGSLPDSYRPTLYDFMANEALSFYTSGEQAAAKPQNSFEPAADSDILSPVEQFLLWKIETTDTQSPVVKALRLFQELLRFHQNDSDPAALIDIDLARLEYGYNAAFGEEKTKRYKDSLTVAIARWADHELSAMARRQLAQVFFTEGNYIEAHKMASRGALAFPKSHGGASCRNLIHQIEAKESGVNVERVWNAPWPKIEVTYRNVNHIYFRAIAWDWRSSLQKGNRRLDYLDDQDRKELLSRTPALDWSSPLPTTLDYRHRTERLTAPKSLKPGFYLLLTSHDLAFGEKDNQVSFSGFWVSDLALIVRTREGSIDGFVLQANSGEPIVGARISRLTFTNRDRYAENQEAPTDEQGRFQLAAADSSSNLIFASYNGHEILSEQEYYTSRPGTDSAHQQTIFFTDRSLYRPGQTIYFKGICLRIDGQRDNYELLRRQDLTVVFADSNGKEIARKTLQSNPYGSFSANFTAPRDRLMGAMSLRVVDGPTGAASFHVEEYKRPKFQVNMTAPKTASRLNGKVLLTGKAESYTGAAVDGAQVNYRVVREVRYPDWWGWYYWWRPVAAAPSQEIAHGNARTKTDGTFDIAFIAKPDLKIAAADEPVFTYTINSDVTDSTGETRSAQLAVRVAYTALQATLSADTWITEEKATTIGVHTTTLDGAAQTAQGIIKIWELQSPTQVVRPEIPGRNYPYREGDNAKPGPTADPNSWPLGKLVLEKGFATPENGKSEFQVSLKAGIYRALLETQDRFGKKVTAQLPLQVLQPLADRLAIKTPNLLSAPAWSAAPGKEFMALWGTGYESGRALIEIEHRQKMIQRYWTQPGRTQERIRQMVTESMRGGFQLHVTRIRENRAYLESRYINVPWDNKNLQVRWEHFTDKLQPGQKETWTAVVSGPDAQKVVTEMAAALYDQSLDAYRPHKWLSQFNIFRTDRSSMNARFENSLHRLNHLLGWWDNRRVSVVLTYRSFPQDLVQILSGYEFLHGRKGRMMVADLAQPSVPMPTTPAPAAKMMMKAESTMNLAESAVGGSKDYRPKEIDTVAAKTEPDLGKVSARTNLNETAFFFPHLLSDANGTIRMVFTMPEALTTWKFMAFAHDQELRSGFLQDRTITAKDLMVQPNPPRFLREGDILEFTVKVSNQSDARQTGKVALAFKNRVDDRNVDKLLDNLKPEQTFDIPAKESRSFFWRLKAPDGLEFLSYKTVGATATLADGEEGWLPVLSRRLLVSETLPLAIRGPATKTFAFVKLKNSSESDTLQHKSLTLQMVSQPAWYAVMALPYLMEFPQECSEQTFNRLYANSLARNIARSDPKIARVFELWRHTAALDSPLEKNQDLKSVMLEETPWLRQAQNEGQARRRVGLLFEDNHIGDELSRAMQKLKDMQLSDGAWPWFPGGRENDYITLYITTGFGRLRHLGVDVEVEPAIRSLTRLDRWMQEHYDRIMKSPRPEEYVPTHTDALYLYGRSFFLKDQPPSRDRRQTVAFFLKQARKYWLQTVVRQTQGHLAIALKRWGGSENTAVATAIMTSIKERSVANEEMGRFWRDTELSWWWYHAPIETQALMIEAFAEVVNDTEVVEECKVWLLKQKQTQDWKTTKATADAVYGLLLRGVGLLASDALVDVTMGGQFIQPQKVEAGTGFYEKRFLASEIRSKLGEIIVKKNDQGVSWGGVYWQYLEDISKITPAEGTPLKLKKSLFIKTSTSKGPVLVPVKGPIAVGEELVIRIELRTDRDMEYVHMKDQRGSGTEPVNVISQYKYQDGLAYYESTRDTASHFFIDYLPKGTYIFEYSTRVQHRGEYQTGMARIQCMYAPEFSSHSESLKLIVH